MNRSIPALLTRASAKDPQKTLSGIDVIAIAYRKVNDEIQFIASKAETKALESALEIKLKDFFDLHSREIRGSNKVPDAKAGEIFVAPYEKSSSKAKLPELIAFFALPTDNTGDARKAGAALGRRFKGKGKSVYIAGASATPFIEALIISNYTWSEKGGPAPANPTFYLPESAVDEDSLYETKTIIEYLWRARDLIHTTSNIKTPAWVASQVSKLAKPISGVRVEIKSGNAIKEFGGLRAVGGSSQVHPPRFVTITYSPRKKGRAKALPHVVFVGKGITFDTGGVSLKRPYDIMAPMKTDMSGAAVISAVTLAAAKLKMPVKITALLMLAENTLSATAQRPSDVIHHYGGTTVEVLNTDAEGRLVLADGLAFADLNLDPDYLIDVATLTGAASLGLGKQFAAMYSRNTKLARTLHEISLDAGDPLWHMPLIDDYAIALKSEIADYNHIADKPKFGAGSVTAALFLEKFVGKRNWVHLDIAGPARSEVDAGENVKGGTAFGVRTLTRWLATL